MKKLLLLCGVALLFAACTGNGTKNTGDSAAKDSSSTSTMAAPPPFTKTLNGVEMSVAKRMMENYEKSMSPTNRPAGVNYLLNIDMVKKIVALLKKERLQQPADAQADGVRIYFGKTSVTDPTVSLLLVATTAYSPATDTKSHDDYYIHSPSDALFQATTDLKIQMFRPQSPGAILYTHSPDPNYGAGCPETDLHYITQQTAEDMVRHFPQMPVSVGDTQAEWFDLNMLEAMTKDSNCDAIRIYVGRHPATHINNDYQNKTALVLTTASKQTDGSFIDYFDCHTFEDYFTEYKRSHPSLSPDPGRDNGELCPNNCN